MTRTALRYPAYKRMFYGNAPISSTQAFSATSIARVGHFNDCFLSGTEAVGTYQYEPMATLVWNATRGDNTLAQITLADSAPGTADPGATSFAVLP